MQDTFSRVLKQCTVQLLIISMTAFVAHAKSGELSSVQKLNKMGQSQKSRGGDSGGGGGMALVSEGLVRLADLTLPTENFAQSILKMNPSEYSESINKSFYSMAGPVVPLGRKINFTEFFKNSISNMLEASYELPFLLEIIGGRCGINTPVLLYRPRIVINTASENLSKIYSNRFPIWMQEPLAYFYEEGIVLSGGVVERMDQRNRDGLGVHECLRYFNANNFQMSLTTPEIEAITRLVLKSPLSQDEALIGSAKRKYQDVLVLRQNEYMKSFSNDQDTLREYQQAYKDYRNSKRELVRKTLDPEAPSDAVAQYWDDIDSLDWKNLSIIGIYGHTSQAVGMNRMSRLFSQMGADPLKIKLPFVELNKLEVKTVLNSIEWVDADYSGPTTSTYRGQNLCLALDLVVKKAWNGDQSVLEAKKMADQYCLTKETQEQLGSNRELIGRIQRIGSDIAQSGTMTQKQRAPGAQLVFTAIDALQSF